MKVQSLGLGLNHKAEFLGLCTEGQVLGLSLEFGLVVGLGISRPTTRL